MLLTILYKDVPLIGFDVSLTNALSFDVIAVKIDWAQGDKAWILWWA